jgi:hypothetical protein
MRFNIPFPSLVLADVLRGKQPEACNAVKVTDDCSYMCSLKFNVFYASTSPVNLVRYSGGGVGEN